MHRAQQRGQCTKSYILIQATWVFVDKMLNCSMMTSKINTEYTEFCRIMKRSRWSGFNNTHQSHYTMTESNRSLPPAYFNLLHRVSELSCVDTEYTMASTTLDHVKDLDHVEHPEEITLNRLQFATQDSFVAQYFLAEYISYAVYFLKKKANFLKVVYLVLVVLW